MSYFLIGLSAVLRMSKSASLVKPNIQYCVYPEQPGVSLELGMLVSGASTKVNLFCAMHDARDQSDSLYGSPHLEPRQF